MKRKIRRILGIAVLGTGIVWLILFLAWVTTSVTTGHTALVLMDPGLLAILGITALVFVGWRLAFRGKVKHG